MHARKAFVTIREGHDTAMTQAYSDATLQAFRERVAAQIGMRFGGERDGDLLRALEALAPAQGDISASAVLARWITAPWAREQVEAVAEQLSVGETYFFRDPRAFQFVEEHWLPPLAVARRAGTRRLRLWSAGCSTGEECYSLAISLHRALPDIDDWDVRVLGSDIHPGFLARAEQGVYGDWSFRGVSDAVRERYFDRIDAQRFGVKPFLRRLVRFEHLNLAQDFHAGSDFDLVMCRHVLMYFDAHQAERTVRRLHDALADGGSLLVGPTEAGVAWYDGFEAHRVHGVAVHRKRTARAAARMPGLRSCGRARPPDDAAGRRERLSNALSACEARLLHERCDPALHCLHGLLLEEAGAIDKARAAFRRALFLDPGLALARTAMGRVRRHANPLPHAGAKDKAA